ncbi:amino acid ABC transporter substrate-binding protein, partial [Escherichia coli]|nr:amino acid ABC transporter substrate-binding protein [Escherichia coli]
IKPAGNYSDIFERNVVSQSPLKIKLGLNNFCTHGGLQHAPPVR